MLISKSGYIYNICAASSFWMNNYKNLFFKLVVDYNFDSGFLRISVVPGTKSRFFDEIALPDWKLTFYRTCSEENYLELDEYLDDIVYSVNSCNSGSLYFWEYR